MKKEEKKSFDLHLMENAPIVQNWKKKQLTRVFFSDELKIIQMHD